MIATGVKRKPPKIFQVLEFIGHQETSSGCGLMGLGEKMLSLSGIVRNLIQKSTGWDHTFLSIFFFFFFP